jgi:MFS family permease
MLQPHPGYAVLLILIEYLTVTMPAPFLPDIKVDFFGSSSTAALVTGVATSIGAFVTFLVSPALGLLSDKHGRRPLFMFTSIVAMLSPCILASGLNLWVYFGVQVFGGVSAIGLTFAYVADLTEGQRRNRWFGYGLVGAFGAVGVAALPALLFSKSTVLYTVAVISVLNVCFVLLVLPESLHAGKTFDNAQYTSLPNNDNDNSNASANDNDNDNDNDIICNDAEDEETLHQHGSNGSGSATTTHRHKRWHNKGLDQNDQAHLLSQDADAAIGYDSVMADLDPPPLVRQQSINPFKALSFVTSSPFLKRLCAAAFFATAAESGILDSALLYFKRKFQFGPKDNVILFADVGGTAVIVLTFVFPVLIRKIRHRKTMLIAIVLNLGRCILYVFVTKYWQPFVLEIVVGFSLMAYAAAGAWISMRTSADEQGLAQGALAGVRGVAQGLSPLMFGGTFSYFTSKHAPFQFPQVIFAVAAVLLFVSLFLTYTLPEPEQDPSAEYLPDVVGGGMDKNEQTQTSDGSDGSDDNDRSDSNEENSNV